MPGRSSSATTSRSPNGKWRPSKRSHGQRPPTPSIRLHDEAGCHNDPASAVPANRPMMSTISNTFADYNIDLEEEENENESTATNSSAEDEEGYVVQVKPLPKIRLDLCPAPREEDEYREQNRRRGKKSRRRSSSGRSSTDKPSPGKSKEERGKSVSNVGTPPAFDSSLTSTTVTGKADNNGGGADATRASAELFLGKQNEQDPPRPSVDKKAKHAEKDVATDNTMVDADGFPVVAGVLEKHDNNESSTKKDEDEVAPMFAPSPSPALALHQGAASHPPRMADSAGDTVGGSFPNSNAAVAPSVEYTNTKEEQPNAQPSPDSTADTASITPKTHHRKNRQNHDLNTRQTSREEARQYGRSRRRSDCKANKKAYDEQRIIEDEKSIEDEGDFSSPIFDWLLMICGDVSSFVSEGCMGVEKQNGTDQQAVKENKGRAESHDVERNDAGQYNLDHFKW